MGGAVMVTSMFHPRRHGFPGSTSTSTWRQRQDATLVFAEPLGSRRSNAVARLPGVMSVEGYRNRPGRDRQRHRRAPGRGDGPAPGRRPLPPARCPVAAGHRSAGGDRAQRGAGGAAGRDRGRYGPGVGERGPAPDGGPAGPTGWWRNSSGWRPTWIPKPCGACWGRGRTVSGAPCRDRSEPARRALRRGQADAGDRRRDPALRGRGVAARHHGRERGGS